MRMTLRFGNSRRHLVERRHGVGSEGMPRIVGRSHGVGLSFYVASEQRILVVVMAMRWILHNSPRVRRIPSRRKTLGQKGRGGR